MRRAATINVALADTLSRARESGSRFTAWPGDLEPSTLAEGYAIQAALASRLPRQTGWKLAAAGPAPQQRLSIDRPIIGRLTADRELRDGSSLSVALLCQPAAEPEIAFAMRAPVDSDPRGLSDEEILKAVGAVRLAIEVPDSRFQDRDVLTAPMIVAENSWSGFYVLGPEIADWRARDLAATAVTVSRNGQEVASGRGGLISAGPSACLVWLARELRTMGLSLNEGDVVITGTCTWPVPVAAGDLVEADFGPLGTVSLRFTS